MNDWDFTIFNSLIFLIISLIIIAAGYFFKIRFRKFIIITGFLLFGLAIIQSVLWKFSSNRRAMQIVDGP